MAFGTTQLDNASTPVSSVYVPGTASSDLTPLEGVNASTDGNGQKSAPAVVYPRGGLPMTSGTGTKSNVASSASSVTILASNVNRKGALVYNDSTQILYLDLSGGTASNSSYSVQIGSQGFFELPGPVIYTGAITGIWTSANGNASCTEFS